ncbi:hypothetical protein [Variibacter gotjawalensis]|uniref:hypothetical protein n=1 Tax=Variibacter gotjawalensis TaxID=1333996 RepID=UPI000BBB5968|nr:hypothetical protein [Variibacter gotjawalensis]NIK49389.1 hypothetical protein [Variibacter gotjawalensis]
MAALVGVRSAAACDGRIVGSCKDYAITHSENGQSIGTPDATSARRSRRGFSRRSYSRRGSFRTTRAERRKARAEQREARRQARNEARSAASNDTDTPTPRARPRRGTDAAGFQRVHGVSQETLLFLPNTPKIGSSFVPSAPRVVDSPAAISALPLPTTTEDAVMSTFGGTNTPAESAATAASANPATAAAPTPPAATPPAATAAVASTPVQTKVIKAPPSPAPTMTAEQRARVAAQMTGGPTPSSNTGAAYAATPDTVAAPAAATQSPSGEGSSFLRYAMLAVAGILALGTMLRLAMN